jgi:hypothetical protein
MPTSQNFGYEARSVTSHATQKTLQRATLMFYDGMKALVGFIGSLIKTFLAK